MKEFDNMHNHLPPSISYLLSPISHLLSPISHLLSPISHLLSPISHLLSPISYLPSPIYYLLSVIYYLLSASSPPLAAAATPTPFSRTAADFVRDEIHVGINIGNTFDVPSGNETDWGNPKVMRELIRAYRAKGFDTVRVPVTWSRRFDHDAPDHLIEPEFLARVKEVVGWCLDEGMVTIVDIHHDGGDSGPPFSWLTIDGDEAHEAAAEEILRELWTQIAVTFKDAGERLVF